MNRLQILVVHIRENLAELDRVVQRITEAWKRSTTTGDDYYLDSVALNLHGFYSGLERIFVLIAEVVDNYVPRGENWHQKLLQQMSLEVAGVRPAVISEGVYNRLNEYRGFRHVVRNIYTYRFDSIKIAKLVEAAPELFQEVKAEILAFVSFIEQAREV
jgi:hypothetical protein